MLPQQFVVVDSFPTTASGKVDRLRLASLEMDQRKPDEAATNRDEEDPTIVRLKAIWQSLLQVDTLTADSIFLIAVVIRWLQPFCSRAWKQSLASRYRSIHS